MKLRSADKDLIISAFLLALNIFIYTQLIGVRWGHQEFVYSAIMMPFSANAIFSFLIAVLIVKSILNGGRLRFREWGAALKEASQTKSFKTVPLAMAVIAFLIFFAAPQIGFFISGGVFLLAALLIYVRTWKPWFSILVTLLTMAALYVVFVELFRIQIR